ncbi:MAG: Re/Si-specific NAD(P)(+) transhydrogenase subunit alpha [Phycisphaerales bacterium]
MKVGVANQRSASESRVAMTPDQIKRLDRLGVEVLIERGAGEDAGSLDEDYAAAGATVLNDAPSVLGAADLVLTIQPPSIEQLDQMQQGAVVVGPLKLHENPQVARRLIERRITALAFEFTPRISRAQSVDLLSAMSNIAGYKSVILAANHARKMFPMMMTAAGTATPARVFVIGAGVAGLQAIATAKRLGAIVEAFDVRPAVKEQVESLGARFVEFEVESREGAGGYAGEQSAEEQERQRKQMVEVVAGADVVITTALIPGRPAPKLVDDEMVSRMRPGSVIVDLAAETGGNCTRTSPGEIIEENGVTIIGLLNLPASLPVHASQMLARINTTLLSWIVKDGSLTLNFDDEVIAGMTVVHDGAVRHERLAESLGLTAVETSEGATA